MTETPEQKIFSQHAKNRFLIVGFSGPETKRIKRNFHEYGIHDILDVKGGKDAWDKLELNPFHFILLNADIEDGGDLLEDIADSNRFGNTPIFVFSATPQVYEKSYAKRNLMGHYAPLPFNLAEFEKELMTVMEKGGYEASKTAGLEPHLEHYTAACKAYTQGKLEEAKEELKLCLKEGPTFVDGYLKAGHVLVEMEDYRHAMNLAQKALQLDPNSAQALYLIGLIDIKLGEKEAAREAFGKMREMEPENVQLAMDAGETWLEAECVDEAVEMFNDAKSKNPEFLHIYNRIGLALTRAGKYEEAEKEYRMALELGGEDAGINFNLGKLWMRRNNAEQAVEHFKKAIQLDPELWQAKEMLKKIQVTSS